MFRKRAKAAPKGVVPDITIIDDEADTVVQTTNASNHGNDPAVSADVSEATAGMDVDCSTTMVCILLRQHLCGLSRRGLVE